MRPVPPPPTGRPWPWHRWLLLIGFVYGAHVGLIFLFGDRRPILPRAIANAPVLRLTELRSERERLDDPTLFALPHPNGFAGAAWLRPPAIEFAPFRWSEPPRLLPLSDAPLGSTFQQVRETNQATRLALEILPPPELTQPASVGLRPLVGGHSTVSIGGDLSDRKWLNRPADLPSLPALDLLTNSVVDAWVQVDGQILSTTLLPPGSGSKEADQLALKLARAARFAPLSGAGTRLTHGSLIFEWHTVPQTNAVPSPP